MAEKSKRILIFTTAFRPFVGGSEVAVQELSKRLVGYRVDILTPRYRSDLPRREDCDGYTLHRIGFGDPMDKFIFPALGFLAAARLSFRNRYVLAHAYQASYAAAAAWLYTSLFFDTPFVISLQEGKELGHQSYLIRFIRRLMLKQVDGITAISSHLENFARRTNPRVPVTRIPNGVDIAAFVQADAGDLKHRLGFAGHDRVVVHTGRLIPKNGIIELAEAILLAKTPYIKLLLVGDGPLRKDIGSMSNEERARGRIIMAGHVDYRELPKFLAIADVFVRPSRSEGLGNSFLEAMAAGVPVIGPAVGGIVDFLQDGETGLICTSEPTDIARKIDNILQDDELRKRIIIRARTLVEKSYDWDIVAGQMKNFYHAYGI